MEWKSAMLPKRAVLLLLGLFSMSANSQSTQPSSFELLLGTWEPISATFNELSFIVKPGALKIGDCTPIRYQVIRDQPGYGHGPSNRRSGHVWRDIAIELVPSDGVQPECLEWKVFEFSIPTDKPVSADIALFKTRTDFDKNSEYFGWGVWVPVAAKADKP